tara:strand:- start:142 stop:336 length:195 start_codon:yes stop_codon:yes gene_type:complete
LSIIHSKVTLSSSKAGNPSAFRISRKIGVAPSFWCFCTHFDEHLVSLAFIWVFIRDELFWVRPT